MGQVIWTQNALDDLDLIGEYISRDSKGAATTLIVGLLDATERLAEFPNSGRMIPEINRPIAREVFHRSYRIMYEVADETVYIVRIVHSARNWQP